MGGLLYYLALVLGVFAFALLAPAAVGMLSGEAEIASLFLIMAGLTGFLSGAVFFGVRGRDPRVGRVISFILAVLLWVVPALGAAFPFVWIAGLDYPAALFEAVSGYTTTGATVFDDIDTVARTLVFWRAELQWLGGLMTLVMVITILGPAGLGGLPSGQIGMIQASSRSNTAHSLTVIRDIFAAYLLITVICILALLVSGLPIFDSLCLAFSTVSTGGFSPRNGSLAGYDNPAASLILAVFMLVGATGILWQRMVLRARWQLLLEHRESYWVLGVALVVGLAYAVLFNPGEWRFAGGAATAALGDGIFTGISLVTTTGFIPRDNAFSAMALPIALVVALCGGAAFSTAGGLKYYRVGAMFVQTVEELRRLIHPHGVRSSHYGHVRQDAPLIKAIWSHFIAAIGVVAVASMLLALDRLDYEGALLAAIASFANIGGLFDPAWSDGVIWPHYGEFADRSQLIAAATMILGRIEVIALLGALSATYWRS